MTSTGGLVNIESGAAVLGLFGGMPLPQGCQAFFRAFKGLGVAQRPVGKHGGEVLCGRSDRQVDAGV